MSAIVFDSYTLAKRLREAGFTEQQAETLILAAKDAFSQLATKEDLQQLRDSLTKDLTARFGVMLAAAVGMIVGILRLPA